MRLGKNLTSVGSFDTDKIKRNYNSKPPKLGGGMGKKAPAIIANALGVSKGMPVHAASVSRLLNHPDADVVAAAKKLMKKY